MKSSISSASARGPEGCRALLNVKGRLAGGEFVAYMLEMTSPRINEPVELVEVFRFAPDGRVAEIKPYYFSSEAVNRVAGAS
jgi:hypothetical protein